MMADEIKEESAELADKDEYSGDVLLKEAEESGNESGSCSIGKTGGNMEENAEEEISESIEEPLKIDTPASVDYAEMLENDLHTLRGEFSQIGETEGIECLKNPIRYGELREMGLTPREAYLASGGARESYDTRSHLTSSVPTRTASPYQGIPQGELKLMKDIFGGLSDAEIHRLYKRVSV